MVLPKANINIQDVEKNYILTFLGVVPCVDLYVNGQFVGYGEAAHNSYEFDITKFLKEGDNITVKLLEIDQKTGKFRLSHRVLEEKPEGWEERPRRPRREAADGERRPRRDNNHRRNFKK